MFKAQYLKLVARFGRQNVIIGVAVVGVIVVGILAKGIMNWVGEQAVERAIEAGTGGRVDIDSGDGTYTVETEYGTWKASTELPDDWPSDAPLYPDAKIQGSVSAAAEQEGMANQVSLLSDDGIAAVTQWYKEELVAKGWALTMTYGTDEGGMLGAEKDGRSITVTIASQDGKTVIGITVVAQ